MISEKEFKVLKRLVEGLPLTPRPFAKIAEELGLDEKEVIDITKRLLQKGVIRRLGVTLRHNLAGIKGNALIAWKVEESRIEEVGKKLTQLDFVSHCYWRESPPEWEYNLYTMVHQPDKEALEDLVRKLAQELQVSDYQILFTKKEIMRRSPVL